MEAVIMHEVVVVMDKNTLIQINRAEPYGLVM